MSSCFLFLNSKSKVLERPSSNVKGGENTELSFVESNIVVAQNFLILTDDTEDLILKTNEKKSIKYPQIIPNKYGILILGIFKSNFFSIK